MRYFVYSIVTVLVFAIALSINGLTPAALAEGALDGKTFSVSIKEMGKDEEPTKDELIFKDGTLTSTECLKYGFDAGPYEYKKMDDGTVFISNSTSQKEGETQWEGKVDGDKIKGTFIWIKLDQDPVMYKYEGSLKK